MNAPAENPPPPVNFRDWRVGSEYAELPGLNGAAVTAKAAAFREPAKRALLFFLQAMSFKPGGLRQFAADFIAMFKDRIGTPALRKNARTRGPGYLTAGMEPVIQSWVRDLCANPYAQFLLPGEPRDAIEEMPGCFNANENRWGRDMIPALFEFKRRYEEKIRREFVMTEVAEKTFDTLDITLSLRKMVAVEGEPGIGKTTAAEAWANLHLGQARFVSLSGITHKTSFFRAIARALGLPCNYGRSATQMQARVEDMLHRSGLVLVVDEAHHMLSPAERVSARPELVDWLNTSCYNQGVPVGLIVTPQFALRMVRVEKFVTWKADQLRWRIKRFCTLPTKPRAKDLEAVARKLLPGAPKNAINLIVGYSMTNKLHMPAIVDAADEARMLAKRAGRDTITFADADRAVKEFCSQSALAMARSFSAQIAERRRGRPSPRLALPLADVDGEHEPPLPETARPGRKTNLTGLAPVQPVANSRRQLQPGRGELVAS